MTLTTDVITDSTQARAIAPEWDALAVACAQPMAAPAWMLAWWRHVAPAGAALRIVVVRAGAEVIGVVPLYVEGGPRGPRGPHRLMGDTLVAAASPLARPGREWEVAAAATRALGATTPRPAALALAHVPVATPWSRALREQWPSRLRPLVVPYGLQTVATVSLDGTFEGWVAGRSAKFRRSMRRLQRNFERAGGTYRMTTAATAVTDIETLARLHRDRWRERGDSRLAALGDRFPTLLVDAAAGLLAHQRFRLWMLELDGEPICADLSLAAGGEIVGYNSGWDERHRALSPTRLAFQRKIKDGFERGDRRLSLGWGMLEHKRSFADSTDAVAWDMIVPVSARLPLTLARALPLVGPGRAGLTLRRALPPAQVERLRAWRQPRRAPALGPVPDVPASPASESAAPVPPQLVSR